MEAEIPKPIKLTKAEQAILSQIRFDLDPRRDRDEYPATCERASELMNSLLERDAIPRTRMDFFMVAEHNVGVNRSRLAVFRSNGVADEDVFRNPFFLDYHLPYFLYGPQLPSETIAGFCRIINEEIHTSGTLLKALEKFARSEIRNRHLDRHEAAEAFYLLALECGQEFNARGIRDAALSTR